MQLSKCLEKSNIILTSYFFDIRLNTNLMSYCSQNESNNVEFDMECAISKYINPIIQDPKLRKFPAPTNFGKIGLEPLSRTGMNSAHTSAPMNNDSHPTIFINWNYRSSDLFALAHELGHAIQALTAKRCNTSALSREIAAFLFELTLIEYLKTSNPSLYSKIACEWNKENYIYFSETTNKPEQQRTHNVPASQDEYKLARLVAFHIHKNDPDLARIVYVHPERITNSIVFSTLRELLSTLENNSEEKTQCENLKRLESEGRKLMSDIALGKIPPSTDIQTRHSRFTPLNDNHKTSNSNQNQNQNQINLYGTLGSILELMSHSEYHKQTKLVDYLNVEILPPVLNGQCKIYFDKSGRPRAFVTWATVSATLQKTIHKTGRALMCDEWQCGDIFFINDLVCPFGNVRSLIRDLRQNIFRNHKCASSIRRFKSGKIKKINAWTKFTGENPVF